MADLKHETETQDAPPSLIEGLSRKATQGEWRPDVHVYYDEDGGLSEDRTEGVMVLDHDDLPDSIIQCSDDDANFIVALVNAYRSGRLLKALPPPPQTEIQVAREAAASAFEQYGMPHQPAEIRAGKHDASIPVQAALRALQSPSRQEDRSRSEEGRRPDGHGLTLTALHAADIARQAEWCPDQVPDLSFRGNELAGEVGEACNVIKKLERERQGWRGSRATLDDLAQELADVVICADLCAVTAGIDLDAAVVAKFNATSERQGLSTMLPRPEAASPVDDANSGGEAPGKDEASRKWRFRRQEAAEDAFLAHDLAPLRQRIGAALDAADAVSPPSQKKSGGRVPKPTLRSMTDEELLAESAQMDQRVAEFRAAMDECGGCAGSPGESLYEEADAIDAELARRLLAPATALAREENDR